MRSQSPKHIIAVQGTFFHRYTSFGHSLLLLMLVLYGRACSAVHLTFQQPSASHDA